MTSLFSGPPKPAVPPPIPQVDDTTAQQDQANRDARRRRVSTVLTSANGLPDLGSTKQASAGAG